MTKKTTAPLRLLVLIALFLGLSACIPLEPPPATIPGTPDAATTAPQTLAPQTLVVLYTNDEHGWMEGTEAGAGAANLAGLWQTAPEVQGADHVLRLSGGDNWTGPAISTWFAGEGMVETMNAMGYHASVMGNHEFDFGLETLQTRLDEANFPYLSANMRYREDGSVPTDLGVQPYVLLELDALTVGLIGLTTTSTPQTTSPVNVADFEFIDYEAALREFVPVVEAAGADLILVPGHVCVNELRTLAGRIADLGVDLLGGGHCNEVFAEEIATIPVISGGERFESYAYARFTYNPAADAVTDVELGVRTNAGGRADPEVAAIVERWATAAAEELDRSIGHLNAPVARAGSAMQALVTGAWLWGYPADMAIVNLGGLRAPLPAGAVTLADVVGMLPFDNVLIEVQLSGADVLRVLASGGRPAAVNGIHFAGGRWLLDTTDEPLDPDALYSVLVPDFLYAGGDGYGLLAELDPDAYDTGIHWRQPVIDWIEAQASTPDAPLDEVIDQLGDR